MGFVIMMAMGLYLAISIGVVVWAINHAKKNGKSTKRWGWAAALAMYMLVFWDWIPTVATHQYYCSTEAGFQVYKTLEQWRKENPGVMETLVTNKGEPSKSQGNMVNHTDTYFWNQRFNSIIKKTGPFLLHVWKHEQEILDVKTGEVVGRRIDFSTGNGNVGGEPELRFWMHSDYCVGGRDRAINFVKFAKQFKGAEK